MTDAGRPSAWAGTPSTPRPTLLARAEKAFAGFGGTGVNSPFEGTYVPLKYYGNDPRVSALMIEIRRDVYMSEPGGPAGPGLDALASALAQLVEGEGEGEGEGEAPTPAPRRPGRFFWYYRLHGDRTVHRHRPRLGAERSPYQAQRDRRGRH